MRSVQPTQPEHSCATSASTPSRFSDRIAGGVIRALQRTLYVSLMAHRVDNANALFPEGKPDGEVRGPDRLRLLIVGDSAASSYGVLNHGLGLASQTARFVAHDLGVGCSWVTIANPTITMEHAPAMIAAELRSSHLPTDFDAIVVALGVSESLRGTSSKRWMGSLHGLINCVRENIGPSCPIIVSAVPPLERFRKRSRVLQRIMRSQILRLNQASFAVAESLPNVRYSPFPELRLQTQFIEESMSWSDIHLRWGQQLGSVVVLGLADQGRGGDGTPRTDE